MNNYFEELSRQGRHNIRNGVSRTLIKEFEDARGIKLPNGYKEWLEFSDGGEIFIPGVQLYGVSLKPFIQPGNGNEVPDSYVIIGRTCFGDPICCAQGMEKIVQWSHEDNEEYLSWDTFSEFFAYLQDNYGDEQ